MIMLIGGWATLHHVEELSDTYVQKSLKMKSKSKKSMDSDNIFERWNLNRIINVSGTMTSLGASRVLPKIRKDVDQILNSFVDIDQLQNEASRVIRKVIGSESGCITSSSSAGIVASIASFITQNNLDKIENIPLENEKSKVVLQMGHQINYGAPVDQSIKLTGAKVQLIGSAAQCETYHLRNSLDQDVICGLYVISHHTVRENELPLDLFVNICHEQNVPVIVDMASEYDLTNPIKLGADLVIYSGHKFLSGVTSGIVAGKKQYIKNVHLQNRGIGRHMKVGKEGIAGAISALECWMTRDHEFEKNKETQIIKKWKDDLFDLQGIEISEHEDWTGNPITRLKIKIDPERCFANAWEISSRLKNLNPSIVVRDDLIENQEFFLDPCNINHDEIGLVSDSIIKVLNDFTNDPERKKETWSEVKSTREKNILSWGD